MPTRTMVGMADIIDIAERYSAVWNEPDADLRSKIVTGLWAEDAVHTLESAVFRGRPAIEQRVTDAYQQFVAAGGFVFRSVGSVLGHHNAVKLSWEMAPAAGGDPVAAGLAFLLLDDNGLIQTDYQFTEA
jgi:hypothetical protein